MSRLFPFVQFEFTHAIGPPPGFYVVREGGDGAPAPAAAAPPDPNAAAALPDLASADVLAIRVTAAAPVQSRFLRTRSKKVAADDMPRDVPLSLVTVIRGTQMLPDASAAGAFLAELRGADAEREQWADAGLATVNVAVEAYRAAAADPYVIEVTRGDARVARIGWGSAEELSRGAWSEAVTVPPPPPPRLSRGIKLMPVQGAAAVLAGQSGVLESETLLLRVLLDLRHGRPRAAALGLEAAWALLRAELADAVVAGSARVQQERAAEELAGLGEIVTRAREGRLDDTDIAALEEMAEQVGIVVDQWRYAPLGLA